MSGGEGDWGLLQLFVRVDREAPLGNKQYADKVRGRIVKTRPVRIKVWGVKVEGGCLSGIH